ncbi:MAG: 2-dehydropantoate 2-reductase [Deltaproteobacteria bacterium]|nr:2-dehydropantoate 2-reductase [Deltaproteobacteria bacterium]
MIRFLIIGPGAMGCLFAARLRRAGNEVTLLDYKKDRAEEISRKGLFVEGISGDYSVSVPVIYGNISFDPDFILVCVKSTKTEEAVKSLAPVLPARSFVVTLQNGLGNITVLEKFFGKERVLGGVTAEGATLLGWGRIRHAGKGSTTIGPAGGPEGPVSQLIDAFNNAGFKTSAANNVEELIWGKLIINVGINALAALTGLRNGRLPDMEWTGWIMEQAVREAESVARAKNIRLPFPDPLDRVIEVCRDTAGNVASMLQDVRNKKITEVAFINGAIVREGDLMGIPTPVNRTLASLVSTIQETYDEKD